MKHEDKTKEERISELNELRRRVAKLERVEKDLKAANLSLQESEEKLRRSTQKYYELLDMLPVFVYQLDTKGHFTFMNRAGLEVTGYDEEDQGQVNFIQALVPEDRQRAIDNFFKVLSGDKVDAEYEAVRKDGTSLHVATYSVPIQHGRKIVGVRGVVVDVSDSRRAEMAIRESEERYRSLFEQSRDAIAIVRRDGGFLDINDSFADFFGYDRNDLEKMNAKYLWADPADRSSWQQEMELKKSVADYECKVLRKDGEVRNCLLSSAMRRTKDGSVLYQSILRDITEQKRTEKALREGERILKSVLSTSPVGIGLAKDSVIKSVNKAWLKMFGFENEQECLGQDTRVMYPSRGEYERVGKALYTNLADGRINQTDADFIRPDGSVFKGHIRMKALNPLNLSEGTISVIADISDRKRAEERVKE